MSRTPRGRQSVTPEAFNQLLEDHPGLTEIGIETPPDPDSEYDQRREDFDAVRDSIYESQRRVGLVHDWLLANVGRTETAPQDGISSRSVKHIAERGIRKHVSNGVLIAAALLAGYPMLEVPDSPDRIFGMSQQDLKELQKMRRPIRQGAR